MNEMNEEPQRTPEQQAEFEEQIMAASSGLRFENEMKQCPPFGSKPVDTGSIVVDENGIPIATQVCFLRCVCTALGLDPLVMTRRLGLVNNKQPLSPAKHQNVCDNLGINVCEWDAGNENHLKMILCNRCPSVRGLRFIHIWLKHGHYFLLVPDDHDTADQSEMDFRVYAQVQADMAEAHRLSELDAQVQAAQVEDAENWWAEFQEAQVEAYLEQQQQDDHEFAVQLQANIIEAQCQSEVRAAQVEADRRAAVEQQQQDDHENENDYEFAIQLQANILEAQRRAEAEAEAEVAAQILADNETAREQQIHEDYEFARMLSPRAC